MAEITAVLMEDVSEAWSKLFGGHASFLVPDNSPAVVGWRPEITHFRVGEGGWIDRGAGPVPRTPDTTLRRTAGESTGILGSGYLQALDATVDGDRSLLLQRYPSNRQFTFEKALVGGNITYPSLGVVLFTCPLTAPEANNNGSGLNPQFWEIGLYAAHPDPLITGKLLVAYGTFPMVEKTAAAPETFLVRLYFRAP